MAWLQQFFKRWIVKKSNPRKCQGFRGETAAVRYLKKQGYKILERNWMFKQYELDIIALQKDCVIFVEVRGRTEHSLQSGYNSVDRAKKRALKQGIKAYLSQNRWIYSYRFDIISVEWNAVGEILSVRQYENVSFP